MLENIRVFIAVAEQKNFTRAAELLNISQPGVSLHIRNLEDELGARLFMRSPKQVKLTREGEMLYGCGKQMLALYEKTAAEIRLLHDTVTGSVHLGASFTIGEYILPRLLAVYAAKYPQVDVQVTVGNTEEIIAGVRENTLDLGMIEGEAAHSGLRVAPFMKDEMILIGSPGHPLAALRYVSPDMLQDQVWVLREHGSGTRAFSDRLMAEWELQVKRAYVMNSSQGIKEAVAAGMGLSILSRWIVAKELERGEICNIALGERLFEREFAVIELKSGTLTKAAEIFRKHAAETAREHQ